MTDIDKPSGGPAPMPAEWTYAPAPESRDIVQLQERYGLFVGGEWVEPRSGEHFATILKHTRDSFAFTRASDTTPLPIPGPVDAGAPDAQAVRAMILNAPTLDVGAGHDSSSAAPKTGNTTQKSTSP